MFCKACAEQYQTQSFSGVGAKDQNAEAKLATQTMMRMTHEFMIHTALNWEDDKADNLSL